jgi:hypothetical protein
MSTPSPTLTFRAVKMGDIAYVTVLFFATGYVVASVVETIFKGMFGEYKNDSSAYLLFQVVLQVAIIGMVSYIFRNVIENIPYPFDGVEGYNHKKLKELTGPGLLTFFLMLFSYNLQQKIVIVRNRNLK